MKLGEGVDRILAYREPVDMRKSFAGLLIVVEGILGKNSFDGTLYLFFNKRGNYIKGIVWDRTGYVMMAKKLERGRFYLPGKDELQILKQEVFLLMLDGNKVGQV